jgi:hypothetical protein
MQCSKREELQKRAIDALSKINELAVQQIECIKASNQIRLMALDKETELAFGEKERAFGALLEHSKEHGC